MSAPGRIATRRREGAFRTSLLPGLLPRFGSAFRSRGGHRITPLDQPPHANAMNPSSNRDDSTNRRPQSTSPESSSAESPGAVIGPYTLLRTLGEGGFGAVFLASQEEPVRRQVAIKILKLGMDTRDIVARFEQERQALALMDHPHIAKVLDAGATAAGRPYFVMEYVEGVPITDYCDEKQLTVAERLELMWEVCQAVQHAHGKGIIHRDLKPGNVLVATQDGRPHPKVIDFGVAKATSAKLTEMTLATEVFQMIGTPLYMSPEQAAGSLDIDTRTDVYSLGVLLYELLTGVTPVDKETLLSAAYHEMQRLVREVDPPKPSTRIESSVDSDASVAERRQVEPRRLSSLLRGELDWIVMKALEKDRARRYDTASALAMDIRRHLSGEPVLAAPPSASYRVVKFVRRHTGAVAAAAAVFAALVAGLGGTLWQARAASIQRDAAREAAAVAEAREKEAEKVADFQSGLIRRVDPFAMGRDLALDLRERIGESRATRGEADADRESALESFDDLLRGVSLTDAARRIIDANVLAPAVAELTERFAEEPLTEARLRFALAETYKSLGLPEKALPEAERSIALRSERLGPEHRETLRARFLAATIQFDLGRLADSGAALADLSRIAESSWPPEDDDLFRMKTARAVAYMSEGKAKEASALLESVLAVRERVHGPDHEDVAAILFNLGTNCANEKDDAAAVSYLERALRIRVQKLGPDARETLLTRQRLAEVYQNVGRSTEAADAQLETVATLERVKGRRHPQTLASVAALAKLYENQGRRAEAEPLYRRVLEERRVLLGDYHPETIKSITSLAIFLSALGRHAEAGPLFAEAVERCERTYGEDASLTIDKVSNLAVNYWYLGRLDAVEPLFVRVLDYWKGRDGDESLGAAEAKINLAILYQRLDRVDEARALLESAAAVLTKLRGAEHPVTLRAKSSLAVLVFGQGDPSAAATLLAEILPARRNALGESSPETLETEHNLAEAYLELDRDADAEPLLRHCVEARRRVIGPTHPHTLESILKLAFLLVDAGRESEAIPFFEESIAARRTAALAEGASPESLVACAQLLADVPVESLRNAEEAIALATRANEMTEGKDPKVLAALARAHAAAGKFDEAIAAQRRAIERLPAEAKDRARYEERLAEYEAGPEGETGLPR